MAERGAAMSDPGQRDDDGPRCPDCGHMLDTGCGCVCCVAEYRGPSCGHPHNLPYNDECAVWWLRGTPQWRQAHTNLPEGGLAARQSARRAVLERDS